MDTRLALYDLAAQHRLDANAAAQLEQRAGLRDEPAALAHWLPRGVAVLAAALGGLGVILWIAANWDTLGRFGRFALLQGVVLVMCAGALWRPAARAPLGLMALLGIGGLFAYFGQTYQTGADPWQLFALWAVLALPLCLAARSDVLWAPWALVVMTAISLWVHAHTGHRWRTEPHDLAAHAIGWGAAGLLVFGFSPAWRRFSGAGVWALRTALTLSVVMVTATALGGLFMSHLAPHYALGLALLAVAAVLFALPALFDVFGSSAVALGINVLVVAGLARALLDKHHGEPIGELLLLGLIAAGLLAGTVNVVLRLARRQPSSRRTPGSIAAVDPGVRRDDGLDQIMRTAIAAGLLPAGATRPAQDTRPWPVVLLTGLGAWLAAIPLLGVVGILLGDMITRSAGPYVVGLLVLAGALVVLRAREVPLFVEQLAVPALLVGGGTLAFGLYRDLPMQAASAMLALVALAFARAVPPPWLRVLLGAAAAVLATFACLPRHWDLFDGNQLTRFGVAWHATLALWLIALGVQRRAPARDAAALESIAAGWLLATLAGLAAWSGMSFLVGASLGEPGAIARELAPHFGGSALLQAVSVLLALAAAFPLARTWPTLRRPWCAGVAAVLVALAWFMPALGAVLLALALCAGTQRWRLASAAALAAAWIVGSFYYQLHWSLADKALVLVGAAALLAALAWWAPRTPGARESSAPAALPRAAQAGIAATALAVLAVANLGIWQKEQLIAHGQPVYVELAPVDPRSLMQGDFMRLNFRVPGGVQTEIDGLLSTQRPKVIVRLDERGVANVLRLDAGEPLAVGERRVELTPKDGRWVFVSDAWFFKEGEGERWARAKYGEFRVGDDGRALLVGLRGADLQPL